MIRWNVTRLILALGLACLAAPATADSSSGLDGAPAEVRAFLERVFQHLPSSEVKGYKFESWSMEGKPTSEGVGVKAVEGIDPEKVIARVMDVNHYVGNVEHVAECREIQDPRFTLPQKVRFYQKIDIPILGNVQHELVLVRAGKVHGYDVAYWYMLEDETKALNKSAGFRSAYNVGAWLVAPGVIGYALSSAPMREDVGWTTWQLLTTGADLTAKPVIEGSIEGMAKWAKK